ncbi:hypothetical protein [Devosia sp.]|uniref:hypothetical protein n=1 Tax=Devosia sp. TaxID=1871048 RepID=UPI002736B5EB|nr:hypothetical protein [Devosia sp.]MDP2782597.1 hypothetical protein [Devosia sp.]
MKKVWIAASVFIGAVGFNAAFAKDGMTHHDNHQHEMHMADTRISLGLPAQMKQHQLSNMREHMEAIKSITGLISENKFDEASKIAHAKLGLTADMQAMCNMFENKNFKSLGLAFHKSGDDLGDVLKTRNMNTSLRALNKTMQYCVECHATFRQ